MSRRQGRRKRIRSPQKALRPALVAALLAVSGLIAVPPATACTPTTTALQFDGGYLASMCYRTPDGTVGQAKSGIWASSQAGLLWFFDRENAEVLVKVLNGCAHNGHRWVYVAPVTDLEFNLWITGPNGQRWIHSNAQGTTASTKADTRAFQCSTAGYGDESRIASLSVEPARLSACPGGQTGRRDHPG